MHSIKPTLTIFLTGATIAFYLWRRNRLVHSQSESPPKVGHHCPQNRLDLKRPERSEPSTPRPGVCLRQVYPTPENETETDIDIIAIHGLDAKSPETWIWKPNSNWLADPDMLPETAGPARIFTCDWSADLFERSDSIQKTIHEIALLLLAGVKARPLVANGRANEDRPILFIASCLGGIILMEALVAATHEYLPVRKSTRGVIFLATPFQGTSFGEVASWAVPGLQAWAAIRGRQVTKLLDNLKGPTFPGVQLVGDFTRLCQDKKRPYQVMTFYELRKTNLYRKLFPWLPIFFPGATKQLVDMPSAVLHTGHASLPLDRPHVLMNKFCCPEDPDYKLVAGKVAEFLWHIRHDADAWIRDQYYTDKLLQIERLSGKLLDMKQCYINLAIVEEPSKQAGRMDKGSGEAAVPRTSAFSLPARLKVETPDKNMQVELPSLFDPRKKDSDDQKEPPKRILIRGRAGVGKTSLCKKMVYEFANRSEEFRKWINLFDRVLWVPLRRLKEWSPRQYDLQELFSHEYFAAQQDRDIRTDLAKELQRLVGSGRTLFILDGLDEISQELSHDDHKSKFLRDLLNQPNVVITSRPYVSLPDRVQSPDLELETIGFYPEHVTEYLQATFSNPNIVSEVQKFLRRHQLIQGLLRIPVQLDALCYTWGDRSPSDLVPETMTQLYEAIELKLWKKDICRNKKMSIQNARGRSEIENWAGTDMRLLEFFAFSGLYNDVIDFVSTHRDNIYEKFEASEAKPSLKDQSFDDTLAMLSFLRTSDGSAENRSTTYHFLHLTFQEYFAAQYFVRQWKAQPQRPLTCITLKAAETEDTDPTDIEPATFLQKHKYNARYDIFWRFVAGLLKGKANGFFQMIEKEPRDLLGPTHQRLVMHCLSEVSREMALRETLEKSYQSGCSLSATSQNAHA